MANQRAPFADGRESAAGGRSDGLVLARGFGRSLACAPTLREHRAHHQLNLVEKHERKHDRTDRVRRENHLRHRNAGRETLLRTAEDDRDLVGAREAEALGRERRDEQRRRQQQDIDREQPRERPERNRMPDAFVHGFAERDVHDEQNRALIDELEHRAMPVDPLADGRPQQLPGNERHEQLQRDVADGVPRRAGRRAVIAHDDPDERRRDENAEQARRGRAAHGGRHVALCHRRERNRRLHRGRQRAQKQDAGVERRRHERRQHRFEREPEQWKEREGAEQHDEMQPPVRRAGDDRLAGKLRAMQEEQEADGDIGDPVECDRRAAAAGQKARDDDGADERQREVVGKKFGPCHQRVSYLDTPAAGRGVFCVKSGKTMIFARTRLNWQIHLLDRLMTRPHETTCARGRPNERYSKTRAAREPISRLSDSFVQHICSSYVWSSEMLGGSEKL
ncbi:Atu protein [Burkholderia sp. SJ98]|nr:Atu protein [Burkholderia sp. SJ98]